MILILAAKNAHCCSSSRWQLDCLLALLLHNKLSYYLASVNWLANYSAALAFLVISDFSKVQIGFQKLCHFHWEHALYVHKLFTCITFVNLLTSVVNLTVIRTCLWSLVYHLSSSIHKRVRYARNCLN